MTPSDKIDTRVAALSISAVLAALKMDGNDWIAQWEWSWIVAPIWIVILLDGLALILKWLSKLLNVIAKRLITKP
ncbi:MAG: hypothetical protein ACR2OV_09305 [Hyphomicrobiaceae bacterium]